MKELKMLEVEIQLLKMEKIVLFLELNLACEKCMFETNKQRMAYITDRPDLSNLF